MNMKVLGSYKVAVHADMEQPLLWLGFVRPHTYNNLMPPKSRVRVGSFVCATMRVKEEKEEEGGDGETKAKIQTVNARLLAQIEEQVRVRLGFHL